MKKPLLKKNRKTCPFTITPITIIAISLAFIGLAGIAFALPTAPTIKYISTMESPVSGATLVDNSSHTGGTINVMNLNVTSKNLHWKAYVGNVTGRLVLEDSGNYSIYEWTVTTVSGEVYAVRNNNVNWTTVTCANSSHVQTEMNAMNHTSTYTPYDGINNTFSDNNNHAGFLAGPSTISSNSCNYTINTYINDSSQSGTQKFEEVLLHDGTNLIYTTIMEQDEYGYSTGSRYDYQLLVAEKGEPGFEGQSTSYYFYVELL